MAWCRLGPRKLRFYSFRVIYVATFPSQMSFDGHLYKTDTQSWSLPFFTGLVVYETDISLRRTHSAVPEVFVLEGVDCTAILVIEAIPLAVQINVVLSLSYLPRS